MKQGCALVFRPLQGSGVALNQAFALVDTHCLHVGKAAPQGSIACILRKVKNHTNIGEILTRCPGRPSENHFDERQSLCLLSLFGENWHALCSVCYSIRSKTRWCCRRGNLDDEHTPLRPKCYLAIESLDGEMGSRSKPNRILSLHCTLCLGMGSGMHSM